MLMSGSIMRFFSPFPDSWRTGATSVHDWFALGIGISLIGHVMFATRDPIAMRAMRSGPVPEPWARTHWPRWHAETGQRHHRVRRKRSGRSGARSLISVG